LSKQTNKQRNLKFGKQEMKSVPGIGTMEIINDAFGAN
jgi:hypothetical protein